MVTINTKIFMKNLKKVNRSKYNKFLPVLNCVYVKVEGNKMTLATTDLSNKSMSVFDVESDQDFEVCIPLNTEGVDRTKNHLFYDLMNIYSECFGTIKMRYFPTEIVEISAEKSIANILCISSEEFPKSILLDETVPLTK